MAQTKIRWWNLTRQHSAGDACCWSSTNQNPYDKVLIRVNNAAEATQNVEMVDLAQQAGMGDTVLASRLVGDMRRQQSTTPALHPFASKQHVEPGPLGSVIGLSAGSEAVQSNTVSRTRSLFIWLSLVSTSMMMLAPPATML